MHIQLTHHVSYDVHNSSAYERDEILMKMNGSCVVDEDNNDVIFSSTTQALIYVLETLLEDQVMLIQEWKHGPA